MSISELQPVSADRITTPADATPEMLASMVTLPDKEMMQAYLAVRFGQTILELCEADQAELYQIDVSGATEQPPEFPRVEPDWSVLGEMYVERALTEFPRIPHQKRNQNRRHHEDH